MDDATRTPGQELALAQGRALARVADQARAITARLHDDDERERFKAILRRHPEILVAGLSHHYPITADLLDRFADHWDWTALSANPALPWSPDLIDGHEAAWDWERLSANCALPWSEALIGRFAKRWDWGALSANPALPWDLELIQRFKAAWDWSALSRNPALPWDPVFIDRYWSVWDWSGLSDNQSLPWSLALIDRYAATTDLFAKGWDWHRLSSNPALPWATDLIEQYADRWDWMGNRWARGLSGNPALPWGLDLIARYADRWNWEALSSNPALPWSHEFIEQYADRWDWGGLSWNPALPWSQALIDRYEDRWAWECLSDNTALSWSVDLIDHFVNRWDWECLSENPAVPWSVDLIDHFVSRWDWECLSNNPALPGNLDLIEHFLERWDWEWLSYNFPLPWSAVFLERFESHWDFKILAAIPLPMWQRLRHEDIIELIDTPWLTFDAGLEAWRRSDYDRALAAWRPLAKRGNALAQCRLGWMYRDGLGIAQDNRRAANWYRKAAEQGNDTAQCNLGSMYRNGRGVAQDDAQAVQWYRKAAEQGDAYAQDKLGWMYENGRGVGQDDGQAIRWYRKAAEQGDSGAQESVVRMLNAGVGRAQQQSKFAAASGVASQPLPQTLRAQNRLDELFRGSRRIPSSPGAFDPEFFENGCQLAVFHIEAGTRRFVELAREIAEGLECPLQRLRPYLRAWYNGARDMLEDAGHDISGMDDPTAVNREFERLLAQPNRGDTTDSKPGPTQIGGSHRIPSLPGEFDPDAYAKAKPHFYKAAREFAAGGRSIKEFFAFLIQNFGAGIKPYALQFMRDLRDQPLVDKPEDPADQIPPHQPVEPPAVAADAPTVLNDTVDGQDLANPDRTTQGVEVTFKPDYGLRLMQDGISRFVDHNFYDFCLFSLSVLGPGQYSTMVEMPYAGELHALSLDFNQRQLDQILSHAPPPLASFIRKELAGDPATPRAIDLPDAVVFGVRARLGELQQVARESFVPFVAQEIL